MKVTVDYVNIKIPFLRFIKGKKLPFNLIKNNADIGMVVYTKYGWDIGIIAEVQDGVPTKIYSRYHMYSPPDCYCPEYGAIDKIDWYYSGIKTTLAEWKQISIDTKDAEGFWRYWRNKFLNEGGDK